MRTGLAPEQLEHLDPDGIATVAQLAPPIQTRIE